MVHVSEIHSVHLHNLVSSLHFDMRHIFTVNRFMSIIILYNLCGLLEKNHLKPNFCREGAWLDVTDVYTRFLGWTTGYADAHALGTNKTQENFLLLDLLSSNGCQACHTAFFLLEEYRRSLLAGC